MNSDLPKQTPKIAIRTWLAQRGMSQNDLAKLPGLKTPYISWCVKDWPSPTFQIFRFRMRIERHTGLELWTNPEESAQIERIGEHIGADLVFDEWPRVREAAWKAGLQGLPIYEGLPHGFHMLRELIRHFYPNSKTLEAPHYKAVQPPAPLKHPEESKTIAAFPPGMLSDIRLSHGAMMERLTPSLKAMKEAIKKGSMAAHELLSKGVEAKPGKTSCKAGSHPAKKRAKKGSA